MTLYPDTPCLWMPPGPVIIDPATGQGHLNFPPDEDVPTFDCPFIPPDELDPNQPIAITSPYRLPGPIVYQGITSALCYTYQIIYWWERQSHGQQTIATSEQAEYRFMYFQNGGWWWKYVNLIWIDYETLLLNLGWTYTSASYAFVRSDPAFRCKYSVNPNNPEQYYYYEGTRNYWEQITSKWFYIAYIQSGRRPPGLLPMLTACALLGLPLSGMLSANATTAVGAGRRPRRRKQST